MGVSGSVERFRFGLYEFDAATRELRREGAPVRLQAQPAQVLALLLQSADRVVTRDELRHAVWGEGTFVDFDRGLNFCISQIRSALRDEAAEPVYIRTIPKQGYQFIAPLQSGGPTAPASAPAPAPRKPLWTRAALVAGVAAAAAGAAAGAWLHFRPARVAPVIAVVRFDNETGDPEKTRISDAITDNLVAQLTAAGGERYGVIGNAQILRSPREQRDLNAIASSLHAGYIILGQVQSNGSETRILAHLIRLPGQKHLRVVRLDRPPGDALALESEVAKRISDEFSARVLADSHAPANR